MIQRLQILLMPPSSPQSVRRSDFQFVYKYICSKMRRETALCVLRRWMNEYTRTRRNMLQSSLWGWGLRSGAGVRALYKSHSHTWLRVWLWLPCRCGLEYKHITEIDWTVRGRICIKKNKFNELKLIFIPQTEWNI